MAYTHYKPGMNLIDIGSYAASNRYFYYLILIAGNMILLPGAVLSFVIYKGQTDLAFKQGRQSVGLLIMGFIALGLVSGIVKEILFRGLAKVFCG